MSLTRISFVHRNNLCLWKIHVKNLFIKIIKCSRDTHVRREQSKAKYNENLFREKIFSVCLREKIVAQVSIAKRNLIIFQNPVSLKWSCWYIKLVSNKFYTYILDTIKEKRQDDFNDAFSRHCKKLVSSCCIRSLFRIYVPVTQYDVVTSVYRYPSSRAAIKSINSRTITNR